MQEMVVDYEGHELVINQYELAHGSPSNTLSVSLLRYTGCCVFLLPWQQQGRILGDHIPIVIPAFHTPTRIANYTLPTSLALCSTAPSSSKSHFQSQQQGIESLRRGLVCDVDHEAEKGHADAQLSLSLPSHSVWYPSPWCCQPHLE